MIRTLVFLLLVVVGIATAQVTLQEAVSAYCKCGDVR